MSNMCYMKEELEMNILQKIQIERYKYDNLNHKPANVVFISRNMFVKLVKETEWQLGNLITDYNKLSVNGCVNGLDIYEVSGKENVLRVSRIDEDEV